MSVDTSRTHIIKRENGWAVKKEGASKASRVFDTKELALKSVKNSTYAGTDIVIHRSDGSVEKWQKAK